MTVAITTSLLVIALQSFAGFLGHLGESSLDWAVVVPFIIMATLGSIVGSVVAKLAPPQALRRGFAALILLVAIVVVASATAGGWAFLDVADRAGLRLHRRRLHFG